MRPFRAGAPAGQPRAGRILRIKLGINPNSSSIGTIVFAMPAALLGVTVAFGATAALLTARALGPAASADDEELPPSDEGGSSSSGPPGQGAGAESS